MSVYATDEIDRLVAVDDCHAELVKALVGAHKPRRVLEFGFGTGKVTQKIFEYLISYVPGFTYTLVDNWSDHGGNQPAINKWLEGGICIICRDEGEFVKNCKETYDFIFSDGDHHNTHRWWRKVYGEMLSPGGILCYHDVTNPDFSNLLGIYRECVQKNIPHALFNKNSRSGERCERGLLVIFKSPKVFI